MRTKWMALALALALTFSLGTAPALAAEPDSGAAPAQEADAAPETAEEDTPSGSGETPARDGEDAENGDTPSGGETPEDGEASAPAEEVPSPAGPDPDPQPGLETDETPESEWVPDPEGTATFENVERRMREGNLQVLALQESIDMLESIDYEELQEDLRKQVNQIAKAQWYMVLLGQNGTLAYEQMDQAYDAVREQFDAVRDGEMQADNADTLWNLRNLQDQIVLAGEATYVALAAMDLQEDSLERQLAAADRTVAEMELRYQLGQISTLQLSQTRAGRVSLASGLETLRMNQRTYKIQLELLLGAEMTGELALAPMPAVTEDQLSALDLEADLETAKSRSYELHDAANTLEDERETYEDAGDRYGYNEEHMEFRQARHTWNAAQYTYENTVQDFERRFRLLYDQVLDYRQIWATSQIALETQQLSCAASELKYQQGAISQYELLSARDELADAEDAVESAAIDLFSAYNTYLWAVEHGILN